MNENLELLPDTFDLLICVWDIACAQGIPLSSCFKPTKFPDLYISKVLYPPKLESLPSKMAAPPSYSRPSTIPRDLLTETDLETASIYSAAPSYHSVAPSYHSTVPDSTATSQTRNGLRSTTSDPFPTLAHFRQPSWSTTRSNPTARHYHSVAARRAARDAERDRAHLLRTVNSGMDPIQAVKQLVEIRELEEFGDEEEGVEGRRVRPLEDETLVGEEAARQERERRRRGQEVLEREDRRWDWMLGKYSYSPRRRLFMWRYVQAADLWSVTAQMNDWDVREKSWVKFRKEAEKPLGHKLIQKLRFGRKKGGA
jgi:hypothetical protein